MKVASKAAWVGTTCLGMVIMIAPLAWGLVSSLRPIEHLFEYPPRWIPSELDFSAYTNIWTAAPLLRWLVNSSFLAVMSTIGNVISCSLVGYGFAQFRFAYKEVLFVLVLGTLMMPKIITLLPLYLGFSALGLIDTYWPLILPNWLAAGGQSALYIFIFRQFFMTVPQGLIEAARCDGAPEWSIFVRIVLPMSKAAVATVVVLSVVFAWGEFLEPLIFLNTLDNYPVSVGLQVFKDQMGTTQLISYLLAATIIAIVPVLAVFLFAQKYFVEGIALQGIK